MVGDQSVIMEFFIIILAIGFSIYWLIRHPIKSVKFIGAVLGLITLGFVGAAAAVVGLVWLIG